LDGHRYPSRALRRYSVPDARKRDFAYLCQRSFRPSELRQVDVLVSQGQNMVDAIRQIGVSEVTYYPWRQEFGGLKTE
jgi:transposase-like protein